MRCVKVGSVALIAGLAVACVLAAPAAAKEGVRATLTTPIPLDAAPGTKLHVAWKLASRDGTPFGGGDVFVRLLSASGARAETAYVNGGGTFAADVVVPEGGIGDVQIGIRGWSSGPNGTHESPLLFPITNDPLPGPAQTSPPEKSTPWAVLVVASVLLAAAAAFAVFLARRHRGRFGLSAGTARQGPSRTQTGT
jgi:hypothetical protein